MKIYTRNGDKGFTSLFGGSQISKADDRLEAYGHCDELNSLLGWVLVELSESKEMTELLSVFEKIQYSLFNVGSRLACDDAEVRQKLGNVSEEEVNHLEAQIDKMNEDLPDLKNFILPGGSELSSRLHMARTVSRRTERAVLQFYQDSDESDAQIMAYLNRLSDYLFVAARWANLKLGHEDRVWTADQ